MITISKSLKRKLLIFLSILVFFGLLLVFGRGGKIPNASLMKYEVSEDGSSMKIHVTVIASMGYIKNCNIRDESNRKYLTFYSTFGLMNAIGENHKYELQLSPECDEIYFYKGNDNFKLKLKKDPDTGEWKKE